MNKRIIVCTLAVFMFLLIVNQTVTAQSAKDLLEVGNNYLMQGDYVKAIESYMSLITRFPLSKEAKEARKKVGDRKIIEGAKAQQQPQQQAQQQPQPQAQQQPQPQTVQRITEPFTEDDFKYQQNQQGGITILAYLPKRTGIRETAVIPAQIQGINVTEIGHTAFARGYYSGQSRDGEIFESVIIPPTVTSINEGAFFDRGIKTLTLPDSIRFIGKDAFSCNELSSVKLPANITEISYYAFASNQLTSIDIPSSVTEIGGWAFESNQLTEVTIPANVTIIGACAFNANKISKLTFSNSGKLKTIRDSAFCVNSLKSVVLPEGLTEIGDEAFRDNPLAYIKIPSTFRSDNNRKMITNKSVPIIEWLQPNGQIIQFDKADAVKVGANLDIRRRYDGDPFTIEGRKDFVSLDQGFANFYISQGKKAGIYIRKGQIWVTGTQAEFDALIAERTK